jgi:phosphoenolpyruvate phosphomutase
LVADETAKVTGKLPRWLEAKPLVTAMGAHNPLGARLVEEAGFDAVWASGFELAASLGVPDASIVTMDEHLETTRRMAEAVDLPIVVDIDTGFGNAVNVHHAVRRYVRAGAAAVVIEDKIFPKDTSLREKAGRGLVSIREFQGKIEAAREARGEGDLVVIARTEAFTVGLGEDEAIRRADAYAEAGADMIFVHSKAKTPDEIEAFVARWDGRRPLAVAPTAYPRFDEARAARSGKIKLMIYGNLGVRAAVKAMRDIFARIRAEGGMRDVQADIATVADIMELQGETEMRRLEDTYLR